MKNNRLFLCLLSTGLLSMACQGTTSPEEVPAVPSPMTQNPSPSPSQGPASPFLFPSFWRYEALPQVSGADYTVSADLRIDEEDLTLDPVHQHDRYAYYNNQEDIGGYEAAIVLRRSDAGLYRVMISRTWQEALLWSSRGGVLQVRPLQIDPARTYHLEASARGQRITLRVDGQVVLDHFDTTVPLQSGQAALGRGRGLASFSGARVSALPATTEAPLQRQVQLTLRTWKGLRWGFDGDQPIFALGDDGIAYDVRLVRDYPAQLYMPWYLQSWFGQVFRCDNIKNVRVTETGARLGLVIESGAVGLPEAKDAITCQTAVTIRDEPEARGYRYEFETTLNIPAGGSLKVDYPIDITDAGFHNGVPSASPKGLSWGSAHPNSVYQQPDGSLYKLPHNHLGWYPGWGDLSTSGDSFSLIKPDGGSWTLVGDPIANPVFRWHETAARIGEVAGVLCWLAFDLHWTWTPGGELGKVLGPGTYRLHWSLGNAPAAEAEAALSRARLDRPGDLNQTWLLYTGGVGHVEHFDKVVPQATAFGEFAWGNGALQDPTVGRGDSKSLRLGALAFAGSTAGSAHFMESFEPNADYEVSAWVRTEGVSGEGPGIILDGRPYYPGITGTTDWRRIGFSVRTGDDPLALPFALHNSGPGRVWFDDFQIRQITPGKPGSPDLDNPPRTLAQVNGASPDVTLRWDERSVSWPGLVRDMSGHGSHGVLVGASFVDGGRALEVGAGGAGPSYVSMQGHPSLDLGDKATLSFWLRVDDMNTDWNFIASGGAVDDPRWTLYFIGERAPFQIAGNIAGGNLQTGEILPDKTWVHLALSHDGKDAKLYLNGALVASAAAPGRWLHKGWEGYLRLGILLAGKQAEGQMRGRYANVKVTSRALTAAEIAAEYGNTRALVAGL